MAIADQWIVGDRTEKKPRGLAQGILRSMVQAALWVVLTPLIALAMGLWAMASASMMLAASLLLASDHKFRFLRNQVGSDI